MAVVHLTAVLCWMAPGRTGGPFQGCRAAELPGVSDLCWAEMPKSRGLHSSGIWTSGFTWGETRLLWLLLMFFILRRWLFILLFTRGTWRNLSSPSLGDSRRGAGPRDAFVSECRSKNLNCQDAFLSLHKKHCRGSRGEKGLSLGPDLPSCTPWCLF